MIRMASEFWRSCCAVVAPPRPKDGAQTGHSGAVSYTGLVADTNHAQTRGKELLDHVILFVVQSRAAEMSDGIWSASAIGHPAPRRKCARVSPRARSAIMSMAVSSSISCHSVA